MNVILSRSQTGERGKDDAMREGQSTDSERGEERRRVGRGRHLFLPLSWSTRSLVFQEAGYWEWSSRGLELVCWGPAHWPPVSYTLQTPGLGEVHMLSLLSSLSKIVSNVNPSDQSPRLPSSENAGS